MVRSLLRKLRQRLKASAPEPRYPETELVTSATCVEPLLPVLSPVAQPHVPSVLQFRRLVAVALTALFSACATLPERPQVGPAGHRAAAARGRRAGRNGVGPRRSRRYAGVRLQVARYQRGRAALAPRAHRQCAPFARPAVLRVVGRRQRRPPDEACRSRPPTAACGCAWSSTTCPRSSRTSRIQSCATPAVALIDTHPNIEIRLFNAWRTRPLGGRARRNAEPDGAHQPPHAQQAAGRGQPGDDHRRPQCRQRVLRAVARVQLPRPRRAGPRPGRAPGVGRVRPLLEQRMGGSGQGAGRDNRRGPVAPRLARPQRSWPHRTRSRVSRSIRRTGKPRSRRSWASCTRARAVCTPTRRTRARSTITCRTRSARSIGSAQREVLITNAYIIPGEHAIERMRQQTARGVRSSHPHQLARVARCAGRQQPLQAVAQAAARGGRRPVRDAPDAAVQALLADTPPTVPNSSGCTSRRWSSTASASSSAR